MCLVGGEDNTDRTYALDLKDIDGYLVKIQSVFRGRMARKRRPRRPRLDGSVEPPRKRPRVIDLRFDPRWI